MVENAFQTKHHIATTIEITTTFEMIISIVVNGQKVKLCSPSHVMVTFQIMKNSRVGRKTPNKQANKPT